MVPDFERVYTVTDCYDGPREGIADYRGVPHVFRSCALDAESWDPDDPRFSLCPISDDALSLALEDWSIWLRWEEAFHAGAVDKSTHPALPSDRARHEELATLLPEVLPTPHSGAVVMAGEFRARQPTPNTPIGVMYPLEVCWSSVESNSLAI